MGSSACYQPEPHLRATRTTLPPARTRYASAIATLRDPRALSARWRDTLVAVGLYGFALFVLLQFQQFIGINSFTLSHYPHWTYQAYAFLHGQWNLDPYYPTHVDTAVINGHYYLYYPPFPAILMLPLVALFGTAASDTFFNTLVSAAILPFLFLLFEQVRANGLTRRTWQENMLWSGFLYFGSIILLLVLTEVRFDWRVLVLGLLGLAVNFLGAAQWWSGFTLHV